jgi:Helix-turn-helix domain
VSSETIRKDIAAQKGVSAVKKAYLYRLYPSDEQAALLQQQLDVAREVYNACLLERREAYRMAGVTLNYYAQANQLKAIRRDRPDVAAVNFSMLQAICRARNGPTRTSFAASRQVSRLASPASRATCASTASPSPATVTAAGSQRTGCTSRAWARSRSSCTAPSVA